MGRPSVRAVRRSEIVRAFARVLGGPRRGGATIAAVAREAGVAPGLVHHHFTDKQDLYGALLDELLDGFRRRSREARVSGGGREARDALEAYADAALALDARSDITAARAWIGVFAEALAEPALFARVRRVIDAEIQHLERMARETGAPLDARGASAVLAFVVGSLVVGAFAPRKVAGFAAPSLKTLLAALRDEPRGR